jgi:hypothetical protein
LGQGGPDLRWTAGWCSVAAVAAVLAVPAVVGLGRAPGTVMEWTRSAVTRERSWPPPGEPSAPPSAESGECDVLPAEGMTWCRERWVGASWWRGQQLLG